MKLSFPAKPVLFLASCILAICPLPGAEPAPATTTTTEAVKTAPPIPGVTRAVLGQMADGTDVELLTLTNKNGMTAKIVTVGAAVAELNVPDREGKMVNVVAPITTLAAAQRGTNAAAVQGRVANRIAGAAFTLDGKDYTLEKNDGANTLHSGSAALAKVNWKAGPVLPADGARLTLTCVSPDGSGGFPGTLTTSITYTLTDKNELRLEYSATTDKPTLVNLTNHAYFNLAGSGGTSGHELTINADRTTVFNTSKIPTGEFKPVKDTPLDFTKATALGARAAQLGQGANYDDSFIINRARDNDGVLTLAARVTEPSSGRSMEVWTTEPGVQLYTSRLSMPTAPAPAAPTPAAAAPGVTGQPPAFAGGPGPRRGGGGAQRGFLCLETQHFPDSIHHDNFPSIVLRPGATFASRTDFRFAVTAK